MDTMAIDGVDTPVSSEEIMLTTVDNPYDPFTDFDNWFAFDEQSGYHSCGLLGRLAATSSDLTEEENILAINHAINDILELFPGFYKTVKRK